jgi:hypothetical protein
MPERAKSLSSAFLAGTLAVAALPGVNTVAAAAECLEGPDLHVTQPGHWYYHLDRTLNRRCWRFEPAEVAVNTPASAAPAPAATDEQQPSFFSRLATGFSQGFSPPPPPQQNSLPESSGEPAQAVSPKPAKSARTVRRERPRPAPPPTTTGIAPDERHDQPPQAAAAENRATEKNERHDPPINVADREALFQDFIKWQMERNIFGRP